MKKLAKNFRERGTEFHVTFMFGAYHKAMIRGKKEDANMKKLMKNKLVLVLVALVLVAGVAFAATAGASAVQLEKAKRTAQGMVPEGATLVEAKRDDDAYEVKFRDGETGETFEVEIRRADGTVKKVESEARDDEGSASVELTEAEIRELVLAQYPGATVESVTLETDDGLKVYEVRFRGEELRGTIALNPETGRVLERKVKYGSQIVIPVAPEGTGDSAYLTTAEAERIALETVPGGTVTDLDLEEERGAYIYEVEVRKDGQKHELEINAQTGEVTRHETEALEDGQAAAQPEKKEIGLEKAKAIALEKVPGATVKELKLDRDDGKYEGELRKDGMEYEFEIDAYTGKILKWQEEEDDDRPAATEKPAATTKPTATAKPTVKPTATPKPEKQVIGRDAVKEILLAKVPGATIVELELDRDDGRRVYEGELRKGATEYDFKIDAYTGTILKWQVEKDDDRDDDRPATTEKQVISRDKAKAILLAKVPGATIDELELDEDDGRKLYEGEMHKGSVEYEFEIDAYTGAIVKWDKED